MATADRHFAVVVHDVAPRFLPQLARIAGALAPRLGRRVAGAVVPCWHGRPIGRDGPGFARFVADVFGEVLQHGYSHRQDRPGLVSLATGRSDELAGLDGAEVRRRLMAGRDLIQQVLGRSPAGFVAPAWQVGAATLPTLEGCGFGYLVAFGSIRASGGVRIPLATWSWDWGVVGPLGRIGQRLGDLQARLRPGALPCVVIHPADADRGYLPRVVGVVDRLLGQGRTPRLPGEFVP